jgi:hypothetical protein
LVKYIEDGSLLAVVIKIGSEVVNIGEAVNYEVFDEWWDIFVRIGLLFLAFIFLKIFKEDGIDFILLIFEIDHFEFDL